MVVELLVVRLMLTQTSFLTRVARCDKWYKRNETELPVTWSLKPLTYFFDVESFEIYIYFVASLGDVTFVCDRVFPSADLGREIPLMGLCDGM